MSSTGFNFPLWGEGRSIGEEASTVGSRLSVLGEMKVSESLNLSGPPCPFSIRGSFVLD